MAYRRKQGIQRSNTFVEDNRQPSPGDSASPATASPRATRFADDSRRPDRSLAAQTLLASAARGDMQALADRFTASSSSSPRAARPADPVTSSSLRVSPRAARPADPATSSSLRVSPRAARPADPITSTSPRASPRAGRQNDLFAQDPVTMLYTSTSSATNDDSKLSPVKKDETKQGLWGLLAQQAKAMLDESAPAEDARSQPLVTQAGSPQAQSRWSYDPVRKSESPTFQNGSEGPKFDMGGHIKNALEEGLHAATMAESRTPAVVGRKLQIRRKTCSVDMRSAHLNLGTPELMSPMMTDFESPQIKASRDVANVMAAKVKLLQRELKTVNADLAFSKERCAQLEEETRLHRAGNHDHAANEDLVRKQLETLLAEKARLATENTVYARENRFLREIVDLNQLTVVGLQEDIIEEEEEEEEYEEEEEEEYEEEEEEAEHDTPATKGTAPPQPPSHHTNNVPVAAPQPPSRRTGNAAVPAPQSPSRRTENAPVAAPQSPTRRADNVPVATPNPPSLCTDNAPESRSTDNTAIGVAGSPMHRSPKEDEGSQQTNPIRDNCSPEKASQQQQCQD
ncbi:hypothetical protein CFC21_003106 [Triticum aestivum]|uniref:Uncharacterized protein n=1 Tax=Triticum aestivum TaxID=4565 RepID=A0A3B5Y3K6_WHEAT|nr:flocculation protein FLO11-like isoform X2 [Triticum aestivum]KAF6985214.1 hypothetical protein CFC21_003106 [Triticum aestivum]